VEDGPRALGRGPQRGLLRRDLRDRDRAIRAPLRRDVLREPLRAGQPRRQAAARTAAALACSFHPAAKDAVFSKFLPDGPEEVRWSLFEGTPAFLGNEFLLWLWSESDTRDTVKVRDGSDITYMFSGGVRLEHPTEKDNDTINAGSAVRKPQALRAIQSGHLPARPC
jgi:hypothetical protein